MQCQLSNSEQSYSVSVRGYKKIISGRLPSELLLFFIDLHLEIADRPLGELSMRCSGYTLFLCHLFYYIYDNQLNALLKKSVKLQLVDDQSGLL